MPQTYYEMVYVDVKGACAVEYFSNREFAWDLSILRDPLVCLLHSTRSRFHLKSRRVDAAA
jgi:hypothetical protein